MSFGVIVIALAAAADALMLPLRLILGQAVFSYLNAVLP